MRSLQITWGLVVGNLSLTDRTNCLPLSTHTLPSDYTYSRTSGYVDVTHNQARIYPIIFTQLIMFIRYLLQPQVLHISTAPINTKYEKGFKK